MREIQFRGKCLNRDGWAYGEFHVDDKGRATIEIPRHEHTDKSIPRVSLVSLDTVGQYIGLSDKNGKKIFEGDYLKTIALTGEVYVQEVRWTNKFNIAGFRMVDSDEYWDDFDDYDGRIEVVGNIHDDDIEKIKEEVYNA